MDYRSSLTLNSQPLKRSDTFITFLNFGLTGMQTLGPTFVTAKEVATLTPVVHEGFFNVAELSLVVIGTGSHLPVPH
jgi:hypothetical protein